MKSIVLDGDKIAEAIQKAKDRMINGEYDNNDLILRGDALKAIRQRCIGEHLPFKSNTPVGARVLDALVAVYQVKPYKDVCGKWISVKDRLPDVFDEVLVYDTFSNTSISIAWRETTPRKNGIVDWYWNSQMSYPEDLTHVTHWMPLPEPPTKQTKGE